MAVTTEQVNALYQELLGRPGAQQYLSDWANSGMSLDQIRAGIAGSPEGQAYAQSQAATSTTGTNTNVFGEETVGSNDPILGTIEVLFERHFGRPPTGAEAQSFLAQYNESGDINAIDAAILQAAQTNFGATEASDGIQAGAELEAMRPVVQGLYQELFGRQAGQQGMDYWLSQLRSGATTPDGLREALIAGAQGSDLEYYTQNVLNAPPDTPPSDDTPPDDEGPTTVVDPVTPPAGVTTDQVNALYQELLGRPGAEQYLSDWANSGMSLDEIRSAIMASPEYTSLENPGGTTAPPDPVDPPIEDPVQTGGGTPDANQYQGLFDILDQRYPGLASKGGTGQTQQPQQPPGNQSYTPIGSRGGQGGYFGQPFGGGYYGMPYGNPYAPRGGMMGPPMMGGGKGGQMPPMAPRGMPRMPYGIPMQGRRQPRMAAGKGGNMPMMTYNPYYRR